MPRYFFHLRDGTDHLIDPEGIDLPDLEAVKSVVLVSARDTMSHDVKEGRLSLAYRIDAEDEHGKIVHSLSFIEALNITGARSLF